MKYIVQRSDSSIWFVLLPFLLVAALAGLAVPLSAQIGPGYWASRPMEEVRKAAQEGSSTAQFVLANALLTGEGVGTNAEEAAVWFRKAADQQFAPAQFYLGMLLEEGWGLAKDLNAAVGFYRKAADQGLPEAQFNLGVCYESGLGVERSYTEAASWFRKAADQGDLNGQTRYGIILIEGKGVERNAAEAATWLRRAAYGGDANAQFHLGMLYRTGDGVVRDLADAFKWFRRAADQGQLDSQYAAGVALLHGDGIKADPKEAVQFLKRAAERGHGGAQHLYGTCLLDGEGIERNPTEGIRWLKVAAEKGEAPAQTRLAQAYRHGTGVAQNRDEALKLLHAAAARGHGPAQRVIVEMGETPPETILPAPISDGTTNPPVAGTNVSSEAALMVSTNAAAGTDDTRTNVSVMLAASEPKPSPADPHDPASIPVSATVQAQANWPGNGIVMVGVFVLLGVCVAMLAVFNSRIRSLERHILETRQELTRANQSLHVMARAVEGRLVAAEKALKAAQLVAGQALVAPLAVSATSKTELPPQDAGPARSPIQRPPAIPPVAHREAPAPRAEPDVPKPQEAPVPPPAVPQAGPVRSFSIRVAELPEAPPALHTAVSAETPVEPTPTPSEPATIPAPEPLAAAAEREPEPQPAAPVAIPSASSEVTTSLHTARHAAKLPGLFKILSEPAPTPVPDPDPSATGAPPPPSAVDELPASSEPLAPLSIPWGAPHPGFPAAQSSTPDDVRSAVPEGSEVDALPPSDAASGLPLPSSQPETPPVPGTGTLRFKAARSRPSASGQ